MKFSLIKSLPFLSTFLLIIILNIGNQEQDTKLRILIWDTPKLSLATYLTISSTTGFFLSYFITTNLSKTSRMNKKVSIKYKVNRETVQTDDHNENIKSSYANTLIERDFNDPSPTINANFRVIGKTERIDYDINNNIQNCDLYDFETHNDDHEEKKQGSNHKKTATIDWNDDSFLNW